MAGNLRKALTRFTDGFRYFGSAFASRGSFPSWLRMFSGSDPRKKAGDVYDNGIVSNAIGWYWRNLTHPRLRVERPTLVNGEVKYLEVPAHPMIMAFEHGPYYDHSVLLHGSLISWMSAGVAYWYKVRSRSGLVVGFAYIPHFLIRPMSDKYNQDGSKLISYFEYTPYGGTPVDLDPADVVYLRAGVDPKNPMMGLSPLAGVFASIGNDRESDLLTAALLQNAGIPGLVISPKDGEAKMTPEQREDFKFRWRDNTTGSNAGMPNLMSFPVNVSMLGFSPDDLALDKTRADAVARICSGIGLDPMVLGLPSSSKTYSNYGEAIEAAYEGALLPLMQIWGIQVGYQCLDPNSGDFLDVRPGDRLGWDTSKVRALQDDEDKLQARWRETWRANGIDRATFKEKIGLAADKFDVGLYYQDTLAPVNPAPTLKGEPVAQRAARIRRAAAAWESTENGQ